MIITKEHFNSITYTDVKDISIEEELLIFLLSKFEDMRLTDEQMEQLVLSYMKVITVVFKMGMEFGQPVN